MDANHRPGPGDDPEALRRLLGRYQVPQPPAAVEERLRQTFRLHRRTRQLRNWALVAAAAVVVLAVGVRLGRQAAPERGKGLERQVVASGRETPPSPTPLAEPPAPAGRVEAQPPSRSLVARRLPRNEVIVEPGQGDLLVRWARSVSETGGPVDEVRAEPREVEMRSGRAGLSDWEMRTVQFPPVRFDPIEGMADASKEPESGSGGEA